MNIWVRGVYFLEKYDELPNPEVFTDRNGPHKYEFWVFSNWEMNVKDS